MSLSTSQVRYLRGLSHGIQPVVTVAGKGLSDNVVAELNAALDKHERMKVKLRAERALRGRWIDEICRLCEAERVHAIGQVASFFRRNSTKPVISLPGRT